MDMIFFAFIGRSGVRAKVWEAFGHLGHSVIHNFLLLQTSYAEIVLVGAEDELGGGRIEGH